MGWLPVLGDCCFIEIPCFHASKFTDAKFSALYVACKQKLAFYSSIECFRYNFNGICSEKVLTQISSRSRFNMIIELEKTADRVSNSFVLSSEKINKSLFRIYGENEHTFLFQHSENFSNFANEHSFGNYSFEVMFWWRMWLCDKFTWKMSYLDENWKNIMKIMKSASFKFIFITFLFRNDNEFIKFAHWKLSNEILFLRCLDGKVKKMSSLWYIFFYQVSHKIP